MRVGAVCRRRSKRRSVGLCGGDSPQGRGASAASGLVATGNVVRPSRFLLFFKAGSISTVYTIREFVVYAPFSGLSVATPAPD